MNYESFLKTIHSMVQTRLGKDTKVSLRRIPKNNGIMMDGLSFKKSDAKLSPTVYLNAYYNEAEEGIPLSVITDQIIMVYETNPGFSDSRYDELINFDAIQDKIAYRLINASKNRKLLSTIPHIPYLDLAIVFYLILGDNPIGQMTTLIHNDHLLMWNTSIEEIIMLARKNTPILLPHHISSMESILKNTEINELLDLNELPSIGLYVLTNSRGINGASCILYPQVLKDFAEDLGKDLIVIPSSIHEVLLTPANLIFTFDELNEMVRSINQSDVPAEDCLSDHIYYFSRSKGYLSLPNSLSDVFFYAQDETSNPR